MFSSDIYCMVAWRMQWKSERGGQQWKRTYGSLSLLSQIVKSFSVSVGIRRWNTLKWLVTHPFSHSNVGGSEGHFDSVKPEYSNIRCRIVDLSNRTSP